jgi:hypothetical protein
MKKVEYEFWGERFSFNTIGMFSLAFIVGIIGGAYGIGGGAIIAPFCVAFFHLPVYTIAGATLMGTFITSVAGALFFSILPTTQGASPMPVAFGNSFWHRWVCRDVPRREDTEIRAAKVHQDHRRHGDHVPCCKIYQPIFLSHGDFVVFPRVLKR